MTTLEKKNYKEIIDKIYNNYDGAFDNNENYDGKYDYKLNLPHLHIQKIFYQDKYEPIFVEKLEIESNSFCTEYGYLTTKNDTDFIIYCSLKGEDDREFDVIQNITTNTTINIPDIILNHYKKIAGFGIKDCHNISLNQKYKWDLNIFQDLLKKIQIKKGDYFYTAIDQRNLSDEFIKKLNDSNDPNVWDYDHPDIIIRYFDENFKIKSIKKIKPKTYFKYLD